MAKVKGIRKRWMLNSISAVLLIVLFAVAAFSGPLSYFYSTKHWTQLADPVGPALFQQRQIPERVLSEREQLCPEFYGEKPPGAQIPHGSKVQRDHLRLLPQYAGCDRDAQQSSWSGTAPVTSSSCRSDAHRQPVVRIGVIRVVYILSRADIQVVKIVAAALALRRKVLRVYCQPLFRALHRRAGQRHRYRAYLQTARDDDEVGEIGFNDIGEKTYWSSST